MGTMPVQDDKSVLEVGAGDDRIAVGIYLMPLSHALKNGYNGKFHVMCILTSISKKL